MRRRGGASAPKADWRRDWTRGNTFALLEGGDAYYPRLREAIDAATEEVVLQTYIWEDDEVGHALAESLAEAACRGVSVRVIVDGYGTPKFPDADLKRLSDDGCRVDVFDADDMGLQTNFLCRSHAKAAVIDGTRAFLGGINVSAKQLQSAGTDYMQDYVVEIEGPVVAEIRDYCRHGGRAVRARGWRRWRRWLKAAPRRSEDGPSSGQAMLVVRDNRDHRADIEAMYRMGLRSARKRITIANAYFFPSYRLIRDIKRAAKRGVEVRLIMQGKPDIRVSASAASFLYADLVTAGVKVFNYMASALHAKVAVIDDDWATVGSSNLDPFSLGLNMEANLFVLDPPLASALERSLNRLIEEGSEPVDIGTRDKTLFERLIMRVVYYATRRMSLWGRRLVTRPQRVEPLGPRVGGDTAV
jgi:cardiolipin synthase